MFEGQSLVLEKSSQRLVLGDAIPHLILRLTEDLSAEYCNRAWVQYTGLDEKRFNLLQWQAAIDGDVLVGLMERWESAKILGEAFEIELRVRRGDGTFQWHLLNVGVEPGALGAMRSWLAVFTNIDSRKVAEGLLQEARRDADAANGAKTNFLANMSHEIRTPLSAIMGFTDLLFDPSLSAGDRDRGVAIVQRNGHQLLKIIDEILDLSRIEAGGLATERLETPILSLLHEVKALLQTSAHKKNIDLVFDIPARLPSVLITDPVRLRQILLNLVGNAIKFSGGGLVTVYARCIRDERARDLLQIEIKDTGRGIESGSFESIFNPFSQADASTTRQHGGTGLGLALSRRLARVLGGDVRLVESTLGEGSTFVVEIEVVVPSHTEFETGNATELKELKRFDRALEVGVLKGKRILLVEDAEDNRFLICQLLARTGAEISVACDGQEGVSMALKGKYDAVLMDMQMPLVDGYEATAQLRQRGFAQPILALTAHALIEERDKALRAGCDTHLTKPIDRRLLVDSLVHFVGSSCAGLSSV